MTAFDAARVDRACHRFVDALLAAGRGPDLRRHLELWDAPAEPDDDDIERRSRATVRDLTAVATEAARHGARVVVTAGHPNRHRRRRTAAKARTQ